MKVAVIGECMVEMYKDEKSQLYTQTFAGDTFNTAVYLKRENPKLDIEYITVVGEDTLSDKMLDYMKSQDINTNYILKHKKRSVGLYLIDLKNGERSFTYYRSNSAAKKVFTVKGSESIIKDLLKFDVIYFSAISLAIMEKQNREIFFKILKKAKKKKIKIIFDSNYRPKLYKSKKEAKNLYLEALYYSDVFLPSFDDEVNLWKNITSEEIIKRAVKCNCSEVIIKCGANKITYYDNGLIKSLMVEEIKKVVDTTAAGDSFNASYLANRLKNNSIKKSIEEAKKLTKKVIMTKGAIIPKDTK